LIVRGCPTPRVTSRGGVKVRGLEVGYLAGYVQVECLTPIITLSVDVTHTVDYVVTITEDCVNFVVFTNALFTFDNELGNLKVSGKGTFTGFKACTVSRIIGGKIVVALDQLTVFAHILKLEAVANVHVGEYGITVGWVDNASHDEHLSVDR
jgi:hypothetical protein